MLGSQKKTENAGVYARQRTSKYRYGEEAVCEICGVEQRCFDRFGMVTCQGCQDTFLPSRGLL